jgi:hypothetical protein
MPDVEYVGYDAQARYIGQARQIVSEIGLNSSHGDYIHKRFPPYTLFVMEYS